MSAAVLDDEAAIRALTPEWEALWRASPTATPFAHPAWLLAWWAAFGTGAPRVATRRQGGALCGVLPAYVLAEPGGRKLLPIGAGTTDYLDVLGDGAGPLVAALLERAGRDGVGRFDLMDVPDGSSVRALAPPAGWRVEWSAGAACPVLRIGDSPGTILRKLRMNRNRAERAGGWAVEEAGPGGLDLLVRLHQARWQGAGEPGVLTDPAVLRCLHLALPALEAAGLLRLQALRVGGVAAAAILALLSPGRIYFYLSGYDAAQAFVSPGTLLLGAMLEQAAAEGRTEAHFLRGQEAYKYAWGAADRVNWNGSFTRVFAGA